jgi:DNA-binding NarL/FixJ family response regulator
MRLIEMKHYIAAIWQWPKRQFDRITGRNPEISPQRLERLTRRERQVAALVCLGFTNRQIAHHLHISPETARFHFRAAAGKLGLRGRATLRQRITASGLYGGDQSRMRAELELDQDQ